MNIIRIIRYMFKIRKGKLLLPFLIFSYFGLIVEIVDRTIEGDLVGHFHLSYISLAGWTSLWMIPCYGFACTIIGLANEIERYYRLKMVWQVLFGGLFITVTEYAYGYIMNLVFHLAIWDYSCNFFNLSGQVCFLHSLLFTLSIPFVIWLYDIVSWMLYRDEDRYSIWKNYKDLFTLK